MLRNRRAHRIQEGVAPRQYGVARASTYCLQKSLAAILAVLAVAVAGCTSASLANSPVTAPAPGRLTLSPNPLNFPDTGVAQFSIQSFSITNIGNAPVQLGKTSAGGPNA